jgi:threonine synthase
MTIWRWTTGFDTVPTDAQVSLGEGDTPLIRSRRIGPQSDLENLYFKLESCNPSGSYKDRFAASAVSHMIAAGESRCVATTSGNTGSALAAYCAAARLECNIAILEKTPVGKVHQMLAYGARILRIKEFGINPQVDATVVETLQRLGQRDDTALQISAFTHSPLGMGGVRSMSFELAEQCDQPMDHVFTQAGGGGMTLAVAEGFLHLVGEGRLDGTPRIECVQPEGNDTIAGPLRDGAEKARDIVTTSLISGLQVPNVLDGHITIRACRETGGTGHVVSDEQIWEAQRRLAHDEGIFCEPAGAAATAGVLQALESGTISSDATVVALITGTGFKDPAAVERMIKNVSCDLIEIDELEQRMTK